MSDISVRQVHGEEMLRALYWMHAYAFGSSPPLRDRQEREQALLRRVGATHMAVYAGDEPVACGASKPLTQHVRGALLPMAGLLDVTTHPSARRRGYAHRLLLALLETVREGGAACSALYPFRESFYERLGYVTLPQLKRIRLDPATLHPLLKRDLNGEVQLLAMEQGYAPYRAFLERYRAHTHGVALFDHDEQIERRADTQWVALAQVNGEVQGVMLYELRGEQIARFLLRAGRFYYLTPLARYLLLQWIARHIDQADRCEIVLPARERPEGWLADLKLHVETAHHITPMVRVLDVARMAGMRTGPGDVRLRVLDPVCPWNARTWRFTTAEQELRVEPAPSPQGTLTIQGLTALMYGLAEPEELMPRGWGELDRETQATLHTMFPLAWPHLHEQF